MKRIISILLIAAMLVTAAACSESPEVADTDDTVQVSETAEETEYVPTSNVPAGTKYGGRTFTLACSNYNQYHFSFVEEANGEVLNDSMYNMQQITEDTLDIKLTEVGNDVGQFPKHLDDMIMAGDTTWNAVNCLDRFAVTMMLNGSLIPLEQIPYIDLEASYWNPVMAGQLSVGNKTYYAVSSFNILTLVYTSCVYFNSRLITDYAETPDTLYDLVDSGKWTYDKLLEYASLVTDDIDGDGKMTEADKWGITSFDWCCFPTTYLASCDQYTCYKDESNIPMLAVEGERFNSVLENAFDFFHNDNTFSNPARFTCIPFHNGNALFMMGYFYAVSNLSDMNDDYGIVPPPKYSEDQSSYYSETYDAIYTTVPISVKDTDFSGAVLETLSFVGAGNIIGAYTETTMKYKKSRDERTVDMIQKCIDGRVIDIGVIYLYDYFGYDALYGNVIAPNTYKLSSYVASKTKNAQKRLDEIVAAMNGISE